MRSRAAAALLMSAACLAAAAAAAPSSGADRDASILRQLRAAIHAADPALLGTRRGWSSDQHLHPCAWHDVACDSDNRVVQIGLYNLWNATKHPETTGAAAAPPGDLPSPLLPALAQLDRLEGLQLLHYTSPHWPPIPPEWLAPGAFPRLQELTLAGRSLGTALPDFPPGTLPLLQSLRLEFGGLQSTLPASWGAHPATLPALRSLSVQVQIQGSLPAAWAGGFRNLVRLDIIHQPTGDDVVQAAMTAGFRTIEEGIAEDAVHKQFTGAHAPLPPQWAAPGAFPRLEGLGIANLDIAAPLPPSWQDGGFPSLMSIQLYGCGLNGTLPAQILERHPLLQTLAVPANFFRGTIPGSWASAQQVFDVRLSNNSLSGPAFPPAWLAPGALPRLSAIDVSGNTLLTGTLPADPPWPKLSRLSVDGTAMHGSVPEEWCLAPFAARLRSISVVGTHIDPVPPTCPRSARVNMKYVVVSSVPQASAAWAAASHHAVLLLLAAGLAAAASAGHVWLSRRLLAQHPRHQPGHPSPGPSYLPLSMYMDSSRGAAAAADGSHGSAGTGPHSQAQGSGGCGSGSGGSSRAERLAALLLAERVHGSIALRCLPRAHGATADHTHVMQRAGVGVASGAAKGAPHLALPTPSLHMHPDELEFVTDAKGELVVLGKGSHAVVYLAILNGVQVAAKVVELMPGMSPDRILKEVEMADASIHERIVPMLGVAITGNLLILALQYFPGGTLRRALQHPASQERLRWEAGGWQVAVDLADALRFLHHEAGVQHNDLKPSNVLLSSDFRACISDLGLAQAACSQARTVAGCTHSHAAPEQLLGWRCTCAADMYSFGLLLVEITTRAVVVKRGEWRLPRVPQECPQEVLSIIQQCLSPEPEARPNAAEALRRLHAAGSSGDSRDRSLVLEL